MSEHSRVGGSSAHRWMNCPGSVSLAAQIAPPDDMDLDPEWTREGTQAHEIAARCLREGVELWSIFDLSDYPDLKEDMIPAIQLYLDHVRGFKGGQIMIEQRFDRPDIHPDAFGMIDWVRHHGFIRIRDYKHGVGVVVEVERNPQLMYYAALYITDDMIDAMPVELGIVQPRAEHPDGPIRVWATTVGEIRMWRDTVMVPAIKRAETERWLSLGEWCRFCPAKMFCPAMRNGLKQLDSVKPEELLLLGDNELGELYQTSAVVQFLRTALQAEVTRRAMSGKTLPGVKVVLRKADRQWTEGAEMQLTRLYGQDAWEPRKLRSPAQIEANLTGAKEVVKSLAFQPQTGFSVVSEFDRRKAVHIPDAKEQFAAALTDTLRALQEGET